MDREERLRRECKKVKGDSGRKSIAILAIREENKTAEIEEGNT